LLEHRQLLPTKYGLDGKTLEKEKQQLKGLKSLEAAALLVVE